MDDTFNIVTSLSPTYMAERRSLPDYLSCQSIDSETKTPQFTETPFVLITSSARRAIFRHIHWGESGRQHEKAGLLIGELVFPPEGRLHLGNLTVIITHAIPCKETFSSEVSVEMGYDSWVALLAEADTFCGTIGDPSYIIVGWYHTHPNELAIFFSEPDRKIQQQLFHESWQVGIVLNPNTEKWGAFFGADSKPCPGAAISCASQVSIPLNRNENLPANNLSSSITHKISEGLESLRKNWLGPKYFP